MGARVDFSHYLLDDALKPGHDVELGRELRRRYLCAGLVQLGPGVRRADHVFDVVTVQFQPTVQVCADDQQSVCVVEWRGNAIFITRTKKKKESFVTRHIVDVLRAARAHRVVVLEPVDEYVRGIAEPRRQPFPVGRNPLADGRVVPFAVEEHEAGVRVQDAAVEVDRHVQIRVRVLAERPERRPGDLFDDVAGHVEHGQRRSVLIGGHKVPVYKTVFLHMAFRTVRRIVGRPAYCENTRNGGREKRGRRLDPLPPPSTQTAC